MKVIALHSMKGGVGKTASSVNLAYLCALQGHRTLLCDLDPQGASSFHLRIKAKIAGGSEQLLEKNASRFVRQSDFDNLDLLPADLSHRNLDLVFDARKKRKSQVLRLVQAVGARYDYVFIDAPPGLTLVGENILRAADLCLTPLIPTTLSLRTLDQLRALAAHPKLTHLRLWPFFCMVDSRRKLHRDVMTELFEKNDDLLRAFIPYSSDIERMAVTRAPVDTFATRSSGSLAYRRLWHEVFTRLQDHG